MDVWPHLFIPIYLVPTGLIRLDRSGDVRLIHATVEYIDTPTKRSLDSPNE